MTCSQIAAAIGVSRNAVIGKIHRLGLSSGRPAGASARANCPPRARHSRGPTQRRLLRLAYAQAPLDEIIHTVKPPPQLAEKPWLQPVYDEPEFIVRNIWRLDGGWYDGQPSHLKPASEAEQAHEIADAAHLVVDLATDGREVKQKDAAIVADPRP